MHDLLNADAATLATIPGISPARATALEQLLHAPCQRQTMVTLEKHESLPIIPAIADRNCHAALMYACFRCTLVNYQIAMSDGPISD